MKVKTLWSNTLLPKQSRMWHQPMAGTVTSLQQMIQLRSELNGEVLNLKFVASPVCIECTDLLRSCYSATLPFWPPGYYGIFILA